MKNRKLKFAMMAFSIMSLILFVILIIGYIHKGDSSTFLKVLDQWKELTIWIGGIYSAANVGAKFAKPRSDNNGQS